MKTTDEIQRYSIIFGIFIFIILISGCTSSIPSQPSENQTKAVESPAPTLSPSSPDITPSSPTITPQKVITLGPLKTVKDPELWFTLQVPESWEATTQQLSNPEGYEGLVYVTLLLGNPFSSGTPDFFYIVTYAITRDMDQSLRAHYRNTWTPLLNESTITINGIVFDRFESKRDETIKVAYVVRKSSANERGFASVIEYSVNSSGQYQQKDFESLLSTFHYIAAQDIGDTPGEVIKRPNGIPLFR